MKELFNYIKSDKIVKLSLVLAGGLLLSEVVYTIFFYFFLPPYVPLFNQLPWGEERLGIRIEIFLPILVTIVFLMFNLFLIRYFYEKMPLISRIVGITTLLINVLSFIFTFQTLHIIL